MKIDNVHFVIGRGTIAIIPEPQIHRLPKPGEEVEVVNPDGTKVLAKVTEVDPRLHRNGYTGVIFGELPRGSIHRGADMVLPKKQETAP